MPSLAAARATLDRIERDRVPDRLAALGTRLQDGLRPLLDDTGPAALFSVAGPPSWSFLQIHDGFPSPVHERSARCSCRSCSRAGSAHSARTT